jgi:hypothetical protein
MSKHASTGYSFVAELTWGMPNGEIPCGSIRMVSQWDGIPVSYCASARAKRRPFGRTRDSGDQLRTRPESRNLDNVIFHAKRIAGLAGSVGGGGRVMIVERRTTEPLRSRCRKWKEGSGG